MVFNKLRQNQLKMNQLKCTLVVTLGEFLEFVIRHREIELHPAKIKVIVEPPPQKNIQELRGFQIHLAYP